MGAFVGGERHALVRQLTEAFDACVASSRPRLVCLASEAGHGKTRIVQELYRVLQRERQPHGAYWPPDFATAGGDPLRTRKVVYPEDPVPEPGAPLPWIWWALRCDEDSSGRKLRALSNDRAQLRAHVDGLIAAAERKQADRELAMEAAGEVLGAIPGIAEVLGATLAARRLVPKLWRRLQEGLERGRARDAAEREPQPVRTSPVAERSEIQAELDFLRRFVSEELPLVLVVDDAHDADAVTVNFLRETMRLEVPALIAATAWPSTLAQQRNLERDVPPAERATFGGLLDELGHEQAGDTEYVELQPLPGDALDALIDEVAPATDAARHAALVDASGGNPLVLRLLLSAGKVVRSIEEGAITLPADELRRLPRSYEELVAERFSRLGGDEERWLAEAAWHGPVFFPELMSTPMSSLDPETLSGFTRTTTDGAVAVGRFLEAPVHAGVRSVAEDEFSDAEREAWSGALLESYVRWWSTGRPPPGDASNRAVFAERFVRLAGEGPAHEVPRRLVADAAATWSFAERDLGHHEIELEAAEVAVEWARREEVATLAPKLTRLAAALRANNQPQRAVETAREATGLLDEWADAPAEQVSDALWVLAAALRQHDQLEEAREVTERARATAAAAGRPEFEISALQLRASIEDAAGDNDAEAAALLEAIEIARRQDPVDMETLIDLETDLSDVALFGDPPERWAELAGLAERTLGADHWLHLYCLSSLGMALLVQARPDEAGEVLDRLEALHPAGSDRMWLQQARAVQRMQTGDEAALADWFDSMSDLTEGPYMGRRQMEMVAVMRQMPGLVGTSAEATRDGEAGTWLTDWLAQLPSQPAAAVDAVRDWLRERAAASDDFDRSQVVVWTCDTLARLLTMYGELHPAAEEVAGGLRAIASADDLPPLATWLLDAVEDAIAIVAGREPPQRVAPQLPMLVARQRMCHAAAWSIRGDRDRTEAELAAARAAAAAVDGHDFWSKLARAHRTCDSAAEADAWRAVVARASDSPRQLVDDLASLGNCLYRRGELDEAEAVEREGWEKAHELVPAAPDAVHLLGQNLAITLETRGHDGDKERAIAIRRELLDVHGPERDAARNVERLAALLGDTETQALALARLAAAQTAPAATVEALNRVAVALHALERPELALEATVLALALDPDVRGASPAMSNLAALTPAVHPRGAAGLEQRLLEAGLVNGIEGPRDEAEAARRSTLPPAP